jgi:hypothetical protein
VECQRSRPRPMRWAPWSSSKIGGTPDMVSPEREMTIASPNVTSSEVNRLRSTTRRMNDPAERAHRHGGHGNGEEGVTRRRGERHRVALPTRCRSRRGDAGRSKTTSTGRLVVGSIASLFGNEENDRVAVPNPGAEQAASGEEKSDRASPDAP